MDSKPTSDTSTGRSAAQGSTNPITQDAIQKFERQKQDEHRRSVLRIRETGILFVFSVLLLWPIMDLAVTHLAISAYINIIATVCAGWGVYRSYKIRNSGFMADAVGVLYIFAFIALFLFYLTLLLTFHGSILQTLV